MPCAVALFSGGLDSMLAIRVLQEQGFQLDALNIRTTFDCCRAPAAQAAAELGVRLTVAEVGDDYIDLIRRPAYGRGKGVNPCVDCRIYMCKMAARLMKEVDACVVITGEILGQRPMSQKRRDLTMIARQSQLDGRLLRPLSAKRLPPTIPEREGLIDREKLYDFHGRSRSGLIELAGKLGIRGIPQPSVGCALTEVTFAPRVRDLLEHKPDASRWDFELLNVGRHLRLDHETKFVVGRNASENAALAIFFERPDASPSARMHPGNFNGPDVLIVGRVDEAAIAFGGGLMFRFKRGLDESAAEVHFTSSGRSRVMHVYPHPAADSAPLL